MDLFVKQINFADFVIFFHDSEITIVPVFRKKCCFTSNLTYGPFETTIKKEDEIFWYIGPLCHFFIHSYIMCCFENQILCKLLVRIFSILIVWSCPQRAVHAFVRKIQFHLTYQKVLSSSLWKIAKILPQNVFVKILRKAINYFWYMYLMFV